eukprot:363512-Chlamydomonas_euryale.AAC.3
MLAAQLGCFCLGREHAVCWQLSLDVSVWGVNSQYAGSSARVSLGSRSGKGAPPPPHLLYVLYLFEAHERKHEKTHGGSGSSKRRVWMRGDQAHASGGSLGARVLELPNHADRSPINIL